MKKENDLVLNMLANQNFTVSDFKAVGLTSENTNLLSEDKYKASEKITTNPLFQTNGEFDEAKFHNFYIGAGYFYNQMAQDLDITKETLFSKDNMWVDQEQRKIDYSPKLVRSPNEQLVTNSLDVIGQKGPRTMSISEIAQTRPIYDTKTGEWKESPNDSFFSSFFDTLVLATYDEDEFDEEGNKIHEKGQYKLDDNGTPYYETLGGRDVYGKQVLNKMNILTTDGSFANKFDFFDSDDIEQKSFMGTTLKNVALVGSMFIPYANIGSIIRGISVATQAAGMLATLGKLFYGNENETLNNIQGWSKTVNRSSQTEYAAENTWCVENFLNMIGDTVGQLAEQRWIFEKGPLLFGQTKAYSAMSDKGRKALQSKKLAELEAKNAAKVKDILQSSTENKGIQDYLLGMSILNQKKAAQYVDDILKKGYKFSSPLSKAYMVGLTVQDTYGEAKQAGASDLEAMLLTLGYAAGEAAILNSDLGSWILPELKGDKFKMREIAKVLTRDIREANQKYVQNGSKKQLVQSILNAGRKVAEGHYSYKALLGNKGLDVIAAHAAGEAFEETSEELLADLSKSIFNGVRWLRGEESLDLGQWESMFDRYTMSALGGFIGGGLTSAGTDFSTANSISKMSKTQAMQELLYYVNNNQDQDFLKQAYKVRLGNKDLSATKTIKNDEEGVIWAEAEENDNQDIAIKKALTNQVKFIRNVLEAEGAKISTNSLLNKLTLEDQKEVLQELKLSKLKDTQVMGLYLQEFQDAQNDLVTVYAELAKLDNSKTDSQEDTAEMARKRSKLEQDLKVAQDKIQKYLSGNIVPEAIRDALFEMNPLLNNSFTKTVLPFYAETKLGKKWEEMAEEEKKQMTEDFKVYSATSMKNDVHTGAQLFHNLTQLFTDRAIQIQEYISKLQQNEFVQVKNLQNLIQDTLQYFNSADINSPGFDEDSYLGMIQNMLDSHNLEVTKVTSIPVLDESVQNQLTSILAKPIDDTYTKEQQAREYITTLFDSLLNKITNQVDPFIKLGHINPEVKKSLLKSLTLSQDYIADKIDEVLNDPSLTLIESRDKIRQYNDSLQTIRKQIEEVKKLTNTPIIQYLDQFRLDTSDSPLSISKHWEDTKKLFENGELDMLSVDEDWRANNDLVISMIDAFQSVIEGMKTDNAGFTNPTGYTRILNQIYQKQGVKDYVPLAEMDSTTANLILQDVKLIKERLEFAKKISAVNQGQKLKQQDKVGINNNIIHYKSFKRLVNAIPDDWVGKEDLVNILNNLSILSDLGNKRQLSAQEKLELEQDMVAIQDGIYDFFQKNRDSSGEIDIVKLSKLLSNFAGDAGFFQKSNILLTEDTQFIDDNSFIWWVAARASLKSSNFLGAYQRALDKNTKIAPVPSQDLATYLGVASIVNPNMLNTFVDAYRKSIVELFNSKTEEERKKLLNLFETGNDAYANELLKYFSDYNAVPKYKNMVFIEGIPGSGKSSGVFGTVIAIIKEIDPSILDNAMYVHVTEESAGKASENIGLDGQAKSRVDFLKYISNDWSETTEKTVGEITGNFLYENSYEINSEGQLVNKYKLNKYGDTPKVIFIDEISHYNQQEISMIEQFARENGIIVLTAGDLDQNTQTAYFQLEGKTMDVTIHRNNFIRSPKLGVSLRTLNKQMTQSVTQTLALQQQLEEGKSGDIIFTYLENDPTHKGLFGVKPIQVDTDEIPDSSMEEIKKSIKLMVDTATGPIGYIYSDESSKLYKYITSTYNKDQIIPYRDSQAQGLEGQYYIVENKRTYSGSTPNSREQKAYLRALHTGISRSEQGVLVIVPSSFGNITQISGKQDDKYQLEKLSDTQIQKAIDSRKQQLNDLLSSLSPGPITIIPPVKKTSTTVPTIPGGIPPIIPPSTPPAVASGFTTKELAQQELNDYIKEIQKVSPVLSDLIVTELATNETFQITDTNIREEDGSFYPQIVLNGVRNVDLADFKKEYKVEKDDTPIANYTKGEKITLTDGRNIEIIEVRPIGGSYIYTIQDLDNLITEEVEESELQNLYSKPYDPTSNIPPAPIVGENTPDNPLENESIESYEEAIYQENKSEEESQVLPDNTIEHLIYTFNSFEMGVSRNDDGSLNFKGPQEKWNERIDNAIGLSKLLGITNYDQLETVLGQIKNLINNETDNSKLASILKSALNLSGNVSVQWAIKSTAGRISSKNEKYNRFDQGDSEKLSFIYSDDQEKAEIPMRRKLVLIVNEDGNNVLEVSSGSLNSPLTIMQMNDGDGNKLFQKEYNTYATTLSKYQDQKDQQYLAIQEVIKQHPNSELAQLFKFWQFTSNGIFYLDDNFNLASNDHTGPQLVERKGDYQLDGNLHFTKKYITLDELDKHPQLNISSILSSKDGLVAGKPIVRPGHSFVLISDSNEYRTDTELVNQYIKQQADGGNDVKLFYVISPSTSVRSWLENQHNLYLNSIPENAKVEVFDIGNDFTSYRILKALIEQGQFDKLQSSDETKKEVLEAVSKLKAIEDKWYTESITFTNSDEQRKYERLLENYSQKVARQTMLFREQKALLDEVTRWDRPPYSSPKSLTKNLGSYLTSIVWKRPIGSKTFIKDDASLDIIESVCKSAGITDIFYKPRYSKNETGPFIKIQTKEKFQLGNGKFRINARIDTRNFRLSGLSEQIKYFNTLFYFDHTDKVYKFNSKGLAIQNRYYDVPVKRTPLDEIRSEYKKYFDNGILDSSILSNIEATGLLSDPNIKAATLALLATKYNQTRGNYGFVYNGKLYLSKLSNKDSLVLDPDVILMELGNSITIETDKGKYEITFETDSSGFINKVNSQKYELNKVSKGAQIAIDQEQFDSLFNSIQEYNNNHKLGKLKYIQSNNVEELLTRIQENTTQAEIALNRIKKQVPGFEELIDTLISYSDQENTVNLQIGDSVTVNNVSYTIQDIGDQIVGQTETNETVVFTQDDLNNMYKEELQCASVLWNLI